MGEKGPAWYTSEYHNYGRLFSILTIFTENLLITLVHPHSMCTRPFLLLPLNKGPGDEANFWGTWRSNDEGGLHLLCENQFCITQCWIFSTVYLQVSSSVVPRQAHKRTY